MVRMKFPGKLRGKHFHVNYKYRNLQYVCCLKFTVDPHLRHPVLLHTMPSGEKFVRGVTVLSDELFLIRENSPQVEVYDISKWTLQRRIYVAGLIKPGDMTSCSKLNCIYIVDWESAWKMHRLELNGKKTHWPVNDSPHGISVTPSDRNVLVSCYFKCKLKQFTTHGELIREIILQDGMTYPVHAIQTCCQFIVCHEGLSDPLHRLCVVDVNGHLTRSYGGSSGSADRQLCKPTYMSLDDKGNILVADFNNDKVLLWSPTANYCREVVTKLASSNRLYPTRMCLHEKTGRLYVAHASDKTVLVYQLRNV